MEHIDNMITTISLDNLIGTIDNDLDDEDNDDRSTVTRCRLSLVGVTALIGCSICVLDKLIDMGSTNTHSSIDQ
jgi:hypothetical protein